ALDGRRGILPMYSGDRDYDLGGGSNYFSRGYLQEIRVNDSKFDIKSAHDTGRGLRFDVEYRDGASHMALKGLNAGNYWSNPRYYSLGDDNSPWQYGYISQLRGKSLGASGNEFDYAYADKIFGTVSGTSTHNSKMSIEDVDTQKAFDYFNIMKVKSFFYKNGDITDPYSRKVSPIIEQLDPSIENLYKVTDEALDINSNLFLLAAAFQHHIKMT